MSWSLFRLKRTFVLGLKSLWMHRLRSTLTTLGIVFGVSSVIAMLAILLGLAIPLLVTHFGHMPTVITSSSLILAFGISAGVGVTFGLYPAYRAGNMDPIESLRHE
jgi:putative ABC transport system permease protein